MDETEKFLAETKEKLDHSSKQLMEFHRKRQTYKSRKQNEQFCVLSKEIKATKQKLKNKHETKTNQPIKQTTTDYTQDEQKKLGLIEKVLSPQQFSQFRKQIKAKQKTIRNSYKQKPQLQEKIVRYYLNYQLISKFLDQVAKDPHKLQVKQQNIQLYFNIKNQMVALLSNQEHFLTHIQQIQLNEIERENALFTRTIQNQERFAKTYSSGKNSRGAAEKTLADKIQDLLELSKNNIKEAFLNFNRPQLMYEIQLQFNKRLNESTLNS